MNIPTKEKFIDNYCRRSDITEQFYHENFVALPCACHAQFCEGWATVNDNELSIKAHNDLYAPRKTDEHIDS